MPARPFSWTNCALAGLLAAGSVLLAACGYEGTQSAQVHQWASQNTFSANEAQVVADLRSLMRAVSHGTAKQLRTVCGGLSSDTGTLYGTLPTPDRKVTNELGAAMQDFFDGAEDCSVTSSTTSAKTAQALAALRRGEGELDLARKALARFGIRSEPPAQG